MLACSVLGSRRFSVLCSRVPYRSSAFRRRSVRRLVSVWASMNWSSFRSRRAIAESIVQGVDSRLEACNFRLQAIDSRVQASIIVSRPSPVRPGASISRLETLKGELGVLALLHETSGDRDGQVLQRARDRYDAALESSHPVRELGSPRHSAVFPEVYHRRLLQSEHGSCRFVRRSSGRFLDDG